MHFHTWVEYKEIKDGAVNYYRICKRCGRCQKWRGGYYWDYNKAKTNNWKLITDDDDFIIDYEE